MAFTIGKNTFVHADVIAKLKPREGPNAGQPFTIRACDKLEAKSNGKAIAMKGNLIVPVAVEMADAEPSFSLGLSVAQVSIDYAEHCGQGAKRMKHDITVTMTRPGLQPVTWILDGCVIENGFDLMSAAGENVKDEFSGKMRDLRLKYKGVEYDLFKLPGGVTLQ